MFKLSIVLCRHVMLVMVSVPCQSPAILKPRNYTFQSPAHHKSAITRLIFSTCEMYNFCDSWLAFYFCESWIVMTSPMLPHNKSLRCHTLPEARHGCTPVSNPVLTGLYPLSRPICGVLYASQLLLKDAHQNLTAWTVVNLGGAILSIFECRWSAVKYASKPQ